MQVIPGFDTHYADKEGNIYSTTRGSLKKLKPRFVRDYPRVNIRGKDYLVHRLIYLTFGGIIPQDKYIDHIDGNGSNSNISNLRLCSHKENLRFQNKKGNLSNTGYSNIHQNKNNKFIVSFKCKQNGSFRKTCNSLDEALKIREEYMNFENEIFSGQLIPVLRNSKDKPMIFFNGVKY